jgi:hypothetical protein
MLGDLDDVVVAKIIANGATAEELAEANAWLSNDEAMMNTGRPRPRRPPDRDSGRDQRRRGRGHGMSPRWLSGSRLTQVPSFRVENPAVIRRFQRHAGITLNADRCGPPPDAAALELPTGHCVAR